MRLRRLSDAPAPDAAFFPNHDDVEDTDAPDVFESGLRLKSVSDPSPLSLLMDARAAILLPFEGDPSTDGGEGDADMWSRVLPVTMLNNLSIPRVLRVWWCRMTLGRAVGESRQWTEQAPVVSGRK